jgi:hypothetical protein
MLFLKFSINRETRFSLLSADTFFHNRVLFLILLSIWYLLQILLNNKKVLGI